MSLTEQRLPTPALIVAVVLLALSGVATMAAILSVIDEWQLPNAAVFLGAAGVGAAISAAVSMPFFGNRGFRGWCIGLAGAVFATSIGGFCGGLVWLSVLAVTDPGVSWSSFPNGGLFCTMIVWTMIGAEEPVTVVWVVSMVGVHLMMQWVRSVQL